MSNPKRDDPDLAAVFKVQGGDIEAFETIVRRHEKPIFNLIYRALGDYHLAAEEAQEVFLSAYKALRKFRRESLFSTWLYAIAVNHIRNRVKKENRIKSRTIPLAGGSNGEDEGETGFDPVEASPGPEKNLEKKELEALVQDGLRSLSPDDREIILLHDYQEVPYDEISGILGVPLGTVKSKLHRARMALKERLKPWL